MTPKRRARSGRLRLSRSGHRSRDSCRVQSPVTAGRATPRRPNSQRRKGRSKRMSWATNTQPSSSSTSSSATSEKVGAPSRSALPMPVSRATQGGMVAVGPDHRLVAAHHAAALHQHDADLDDLVHADHAAGGLQVDDRVDRLVQPSPHGRRALDRPAVVVGLDEALVRGQQRAHDDLRLRHLVPAGSEEPPGDGRSRQGRPLSEQEGVGLCAEFLKIMCEHGKMIAWIARSGQSGRPRAALAPVP